MWEWCLGRYLGSLPGGTVVDYRGPNTGAHFVVRGGSWNDIGDVCRSATRCCILLPTDKYCIVGVRPVLAPLD